MVGVTFIVKKIDNPAATQGNIDGLLQFTGYDIKVLAYNDAGDGAYSNPITVTTAEGGEYIRGKSAPLHMPCEYIRGKSASLHMPCDPFGCNS